MKKSQNLTEDMESTKYSFKDIDEPLRKRFILRFGESGGIFILGIFLSIIIKAWVFFLLATVFALLLANITALQVLNVMKGNVIKVEGIFYRYDKPSNLKKSFVRNTLYLQLDDGSYICMHPANSLSVEEGNRIAVYTPIKSLYKKTEDLYEIGEYYHIEVVKMFV